MFLLLYNGKAMSLLENANYVLVYCSLKDEWPLREKSANFYHLQTHHSIHKGVKWVP